MVMNLFITADRIGTPTGGGVVTLHEKNALASLDETIWLDNTIIPSDQNDPFSFDLAARNKVEELQKKYAFKLAHFYAGTFSKTIELLKSKGTKITYTCAAHDLKTSIAEHVSLLGHYPYKHMQDPEILSKYVQGYKLANLIICPSSMSASVMKGYGCKSIKVIPHGTEIPTSIAPMPQKFVVGYLGSIGIDKGLIYLLKAWELLNLSNSFLNIAGKDSTNLLPQIRSLKGNGHFKLQGFVPSSSTFYNECSVYVQPSVTEGFGIEVLEAMAHGRPVIVSDGAGAADLVDGRWGFVVPKKNPEAIAEKIRWLWKNKVDRALMGQGAAHKAKEFAWNEIESKYCEAWKYV
jgi:glycosyltransferase involved in cell wall biosynthesis